VGSRIVMQEGRVQSVSHPEVTTVVSPQVKGSEREAEAEVNKK
jgi:hypothetical protein